MRISRTSLAAIGIAGVVAAGAAIPAIAQDDTTTEEATTDEATTREEWHAAAHEAFVEALADELGLDTATVDEALTAVREDMQAARQAEMQERVQARLDELVESGELTQEEADTLADLQGRGLFGGFGPGRGHRGGPGHGGPGPWGGVDLSDADVTTSSTSA